MEHIGQLAGIATAISWTVTALFFQVASRRIGSLVVNILRLILAALMYTVYIKVTHGIWWPEASLFSWTYLGISSLLGFVLGDFFLFKSYEYISSRTSMLIMSLSPPVSAFVGWLMLGETLSFMNFVGMFFVLLGVSMVIFYHNTTDKEMKRHRQRGVVYASLGALGQGIGGVFSKIGMSDLDPFVASHMRVLVGIVGFVLIISFMKRWGNVKASFRDKKGLALTSYGAFFGPFLGVGLAMVSLKHISVGVASTIMTTMPVFILAPSFFILKEKISWREVVGAFIAVGGILVFFLD